MCSAGNSFASIKANGDIITCWGLQINIGNIYKKINLRNLNIACPLKYCNCVINKPQKNLPKEKFLKLFQKDSKYLFLRYSTNPLRIKPEVVLN